MSEMEMDSENFGVEDSPSEHVIDSLGDVADGVAEGLWMATTSVIEGALDVSGGLLNGASELITEGLGGDLDGEPANEDMALPPGLDEPPTGVNSSDMSTAPAPDIGAAIASAAADPAHADEILAAQDPAYSGEGHQGSP